MNLMLGLMFATEKVLLIAFCEQCRDLEYNNRS